MLLQFVIDHSVMKKDFVTLQCRVVVVFFLSEKYWFCYTVGILRSNIILTADNLKITTPMRGHDVDYLLVGNWQHDNTEFVVILVLLYQRLGNQLEGN